MAIYSPYETLFSEEEMDKYASLLGRRWIRVDPVTKRPHANSEDFFWQIAHMFPASRMGEDMNAPKMNFLVQRYWRKKTYQAAVDSKGSGNVTRNEAYHEMNDRGELVRPGYVTLDYESFVKQFVEDGSVVEAAQEQDATQDKPGKRAR